MPRDAKLKELIKSLRAHPEDFVDAQQMQRQCPDTFEAPTLQELAQIGSESLLKICDQRERFWTRIIVTGPATAEPGERWFIVSISNELVFDHPYKLGDPVLIKARNVYHISSDEEMAREEKSHK